MSPHWKTALGLLLVAALGAGLLREAETRRDWRALRAEIEGRLSEVEARAGERTALRGETLEGKAWDHYERALAATASCELEEVELGRFLDGSKGRLTHGEMATALAGSSAWLEPLSLGARSRNAARPTDWRRGAAASVPRLLASRRLANLAAVEAELLRAEGRMSEAVDLLLDALQFGGDHGRNAVLIGEMIGVALQSIACERLAELLAADELDPIEAGRVADALALVDEGPQHRDGIRNDTLAVAATMTGGEFQTAALISASAWGARLSAWRYGFSSRRQVLDYLESAEQFAVLMDRAREQPWAETERSLESFEREAERAPNLLTQIALPRLSSVEKAWRRADALLRLARAGAEVRADRPVREWADPFGDTLRLEHGEDTLVLWSRGPDGVDDDGEGEFTNGSDLVLRLEETRGPH